MSGYSNTNHTYLAMPQKNLSEIDSSRFWGHVRITESCWEWTGKRFPAGYGYYQNRVASRLAFHMVRGPIPDGLRVCHHCDNPSCVRPSHLFLGTDKDNAHDAMRKGRLKHNRRLNDNQAQEIRERFAKGESFYSLADSFGVSHGIIHQIVNGKTYVPIKPPNP